jgi:hypothetical protein
VRAASERAFASVVSLCIHLSSPIVLSLFLGGGRAQAVFRVREGRFAPKAKRFQQSCVFNGLSEPGMVRLVPNSQHAQIGRFSASGPVDLS